MSAEISDVPRDWLVSHGDRTSSAAITLAADHDLVAVDGTSFEVKSSWTPGSRLFRGDIDGASVCAQVERVGIDYRLAMRGIVAQLRVLSPRSAELFALMPVKETSGSSQFLVAPMPGLLVSVAVKSGDEVDPGQELAVIEAMKMENVLRAEQARKVVSVLASPGESLSVDQPIIEFA